MDRLFQYCVILNPTDKEQEAGVRSKIVVPVSEWFLAKSLDEARIVANRAIPDEFMVNADRLEVAVRSFCD